MVTVGGGSLLFDAQCDVICDVDVEVAVLK